MKLSPSRLVIDIGNTRTKAGVYCNNELIRLVNTEALQLDELAALCSEFGCKEAIISSVSGIPDDLKRYLDQRLQLLILDQHTPVPVDNLYKSPATLGKDRLAVVVAAAGLFPGRNCLVIDAGTCITFDFIDSKARYHGGSISPGTAMRFKALHTFTSKLPLVKHKKSGQLTGSTTEESILAGVLRGTVAETDGIIGLYAEKYEDLQVLISGGDMNFFAKKLKSNIFAVPNLVLKGLNLILEFNVKKH